MSRVSGKHGRVDPEIHAVYTPRIYPPSPRPNTLCVALATAAVQACATLCHAGHDLTLTSFATSYCDCGAGAMGAVPWRCMVRVLAASVRACVPACMGGCLYVCVCVFVCECLHAHGLSAVGALS